MTSPKVPEVTGHHPAVSVIMNCFNGEEFLAEAIESVLAQTFPDWELVFWDNRSSDGSANILHSFKDSRIKYHYATRHTDLSAARNLAIATAAGEWIAFLDCDDIWFPEKLEKQFALIDASESGESDSDGSSDLPGVIYGRSLAIYPNGKISELFPQFRNRRLPEGQLLQPLLIEGDFIAAPTVMVRRAALDAVGGINEQYSCAFDYYLLAAICEKYRALAVQDYIAKYRVHRNSLTFGFKEELFLEPLAILDTWGHHIRPDQLKKRKREYHTLLSAHYLSRNMFLPAAKELLTHGSLLFLMKRALAKLRQRRAEDTHRFL